jgi:hypothetical protein
VRILSFRRRAALALALVAGGSLAGALAAGRANACSVCLAGDPVFSTHGATSQEAGSFSIYLEARSFSKSSGLGEHHEDEAAEGGEPADEHETHTLAAEAAGKRARGRAALRPRHGGHDHEAPEAEGEHDEAAASGAPHEPGRERSRGERLDLFASWTPLDRFTVTLDVPFAWNRIVEHEDGERTRSTLSGLGDASIGSSFVVWRNRDVLPSTWIEARAWLKAPTGRDEAKVEGVRDPHLQTGTGSWDFGVGLAAVHRLSWGAIYGSAFYRENTQGSLDYTYGDVWLANLAVEVPVGHAFETPWLDWLTAGVELNFRYAGYDREDGERFVDSGGAILYATPSVRVRLPFGFRDRPVSLRGAVQIPLSQTWLHNRQREGEVYSLGVLVPF